MRPPFAYVSVGLTRTENFSGLDFNATAMRRTLYRSGMANMSTTRVAQMPVFLIPCDTMICQHIISMFVFYLHVGEWNESNAPGIISVSGSQ